MTNTNLDSFAIAASNIAIRAAGEWLRQNKIAPDYDRLSASLRSILKVRIPEALADAKLAVDANLLGAAEMTFAASMRLAGIEAAKESVAAPDYCDESLLPPEIRP